MQDVLARAHAWFEAQRREHLAVEVSYQPLVGLPRICRATLVTGNWESVDSAGNIVRMETRDFFIGRDELPQDPKRGDLIVLTENGSQKTYVVSIIDGARQAWRWSDREETVRRIHTMVQSGTAAVPNSSLLVRGVGVSSAASITDEQIKSQLTLDLGTNRAIRKQLVAASSYIYVVLPDSFGAPTLQINGFTSSAWELVTRSIVFDGQAARAYRVYRSTYAVTGQLLLEVS